MNGTWYYCTAVHHRQPAPKRRGVDLFYYYSKVLQYCSAKSIILPTTPLLSNFDVAHYASRCTSQRWTTTNNGPRDSRSRQIPRFACVHRLLPPLFKKETTQFCSANQRFERFFGIQYRIRKKLRICKQTYPVRLRAAAAVRWLLVLFFFYCTVIQHTVHSIMQGAVSLAKRRRANFSLPLSYEVRVVCAHFSS